MQSLYVSGDHGVIELPVGAVSDGEPVEIVVHE